MEVEFKFADDNQRDLSSKFGSNHYLGNAKNVDHVLLWSTFFRRNLHRFVLDYLKIGLHLYQIISIYLMGISKRIVVIAARASAKSFMIALFACCMAILYPGVQIIISASKKGQSRLIISQKIKKELCNMSPMLRREILKINDGLNDTSVIWRNGSNIIVVVANDNYRGNRSNIAVRDEFRQMDKKIDDSVISPMQIARQPGYSLLPEYNGNPDLIFEPIDAYLSSSWLDNGHWMWDLVDNTLKGMLNGENFYILAFDEAITLKHHIRTMNQLMAERAKVDPLTWKLEYLNMRVKERTDSFFTYSMMMVNQRAKKPFYPRRDEDVRAHRRNPYEIPRQTDEIRIVACDMAFAQGESNDNSIFSCIRAIPESTRYERGGGNIMVNHGYRRILSYMEPIQGGDTEMQARRIRQLYEDFDADYIVLDVRNAGLSIFDLLAKVMYDEDRDVEYRPLTCMNNDAIAARIQSPNAKPVIYVIEATLKLNNDIAFSFRETLERHKIDLLENLSNAKDGFLENIEDYLTTDDPEYQLWYERPFLETQLLINETTNLVYERAESTGLIRIHEQGRNRKDRYTSVSYGDYFISLLEKDLLSDEEDISSAVYAPCVAAIDFD